MMNDWSNAMNQQNFRARGVGVAVLSLVLIACAPGDASLDGRMAAAEGETLTWDLLDCEAIILLLPATAEALAPHLPEGFSPLPLADAVAEMDVPVDPVDGNIGVETFECASGAGLHGPVEPMTYGSYYVMVEPPEEFRREVDFHFIKWDVLVPDAERRALLQAHGVPALDGGVTTTVFQQVDAIKFGDQSLSIGGSSHRLVANGAVPYSKSQGRIAEFTVTEHGLVEWQTDFEFHSVSNGPAVVEVGPDNLLAEVVGAGPQVGAAFIGSMSFVQGQIRLPIGQ